MRREKSPHGGHQDYANLMPSAGGHRKFIPVAAEVVMAPWPTKARRWPF